MLVNEFNKIWINLSNVKQLIKTSRPNSWFLLIFLLCYCLHRRLLLSRQVDVHRSIGHQTDEIRSGRSVWFGRPPADFAWENSTNLKLNDSSTKATVSFALFSFLPPSELGLIWMYYEVLYKQLCVSMVYAHNVFVWSCRERLERVRERENREHRKLVDLIASHVTLSDSQKSFKLDLKWNSVTAWHLNWMTRHSKLI